MQTNFATTGANGAPGAANAAPANNASTTTDMFTRLLVAQIRNQDPLAPTDPSQFVNQLAQLSQTESLQSLANLTSANASVLQSLQVLALGAQVGSNVTALTDQAVLGTEALHGVIQLPSATSKTTLTLIDALGQKHEIELGAQGPGELPFTIDPVALGLAPGRYTLQVDAGGAETPTIALTGRLNGVKLSASGGVVLDVAGIGEIGPHAVTGFHGRPTITASN